MACPVLAARDTSAGDTAFADGDLAKAEEFYAAAVAAGPHDVAAGAGLVRTRLRSGMTAQAAEAAKVLVAENPHSAMALSALAEVQLRQGQPWLAMQTLDAVTGIDPCYARAHLVRSRVDRADSMHASERKEIQIAYDLEPSDTEIRSAWRTIVSPANDVVGVQEALASTKDMDPAERKQAEASAAGMMSQLSDNSMNCEVVPTIPNASRPCCPRCRTASISMRIGWRCSFRRQRPCCRSIRRLRASSSAGRWRMRTG